ncbi:hypothetical protein EI94DRAFT_813746 [Lactarius quietus]|nr:hypothetical protein EI94DRAFT_813746 [Lactarius quietus]
MKTSAWTTRKRKMTSWVCYSRITATMSLCRLRRGWKGQGQESAVTVDHGVLDSPQSVTTSSTRVRRKSRREAFPEEAEAAHCVKHDDGDDDSDQEGNEDTPRVHAISAPAPVFLDAPPQKRRQTSWPTGPMTYCHHCRSTTRRPKMRYSRMDGSTGERCRKLFGMLCIGNRYPDVTFDFCAEAFECPFCSGFVTA